MTVTMTSEAFGKKPGDTYTGPEEAWLIAQGYASQSAARAYNTGFTPEVGNDNQFDYEGTLGKDGLVLTASGAKVTDVMPADDPTNAANRELPFNIAHPGTAKRPFANDVLAGSQPPARDYDFDKGGVDDEKPSDLALSPGSGITTGGTVVTITGSNLAGVTGVTFGGTAGTALDVSKAKEGVIKVTTPAKAAATVDVIVTDNVGSTTISNGFIYTLA